MIPEEYKLPVAGLILSGALWITSLYQLEIVYIWLAIGKQEFEMPFYLWTMSLPVARDFWYAINGISLLVGIYSGAVFNVKRMELKLRGED